MMGVYVCPVCSGKGIVKGDFYDLFASEENGSEMKQTVECRTCNGSGIIWDNVFGITNHKSIKKNNPTTESAVNDNHDNATDETKKPSSILKDGILGRVNP